MENLIKDMPSFQLPEMVLSIMTLKVLDVSDNLITTLPDAVGKLVNLQILRLANNSIISLPANIGW